MIELKSAIILSKKAPKEEVSFSFDKGQINVIPFEELYKFEFVKLKDQSLDKGEFFIDKTKIYPNEESEMTLFFLTVNSLIKFDLCFVVNKKDKKEKVKKVQDDLIALRDMPMTSDIEKNLKIAAIFDEIAKNSPSYVLVNTNEEVNQNNPELQRQLELHKDDFVIITLAKKPEEEKEATKEEPEIEMIDLSIGEATTQSTVKEKKKKGSKESAFNFDKKENNFFKSLGKTIKNNLMVFLSFLIPMLGVVAFILLSPLYAQSDNKMLIIPFIITIVICFFLYMLMTYKCTDFGSFKDKQANNERILFFVINTFVSLVGYGLGFLIYFLFKKFDTNISSSGSNPIGIAVSIVAALIMVSANLWIYPLFSTLINKIKKKK